LRYALISDIHANLQALIAVFSHVDTQHVDSIICLGDMVGYGPSPNECISLISQRCNIILTGNHDFACIDDGEKERFNQYARIAIEWTIDQLNIESLAALENIKLTESIKPYLFVHSSPDYPSEWNYIISMNHAITNFTAFDEQACFFGHTHVPVIFCKRAAGIYEIIDDPTIVLKPNEKYLINVGSVGQPRDGNTDASYSILDCSTQEYTNFRVPYNLKATQTKMEEMGLPSFLINRMTHGR
jgi:predicted phosphodiesterase